MAAAAMRSGSEGSGDGMGTASVLQGLRERVSAKGGTVGRATRRVNAAGPGATARTRRRRGVDAIAGAVRLHTFAASACETPAHPVAWASSPPRCAGPVPPESAHDRKLLVSAAPARRDGPASGPAERRATRLLFLIVGFGVAAWAPLVPLVKARAGLDDGTLGLLLLCLGIGSLATMPVAGRPGRAPRHPPRPGRRRARHRGGADGPVPGRGPARPGRRPDAGSAWASACSTA